MLIDRHSIGAMVKPLSAVAGALAVAVVLTACSAAAHSRSRPWAAPCARAEADVRVLALQAGPYVGVATRHDLIVAWNKRHAQGREYVAAEKAMVRATFSGPGASRKFVQFPPLLARQMRQVLADMSAFVAGFGAYGRYPPRPRAISDAAQKAMRDIQAVRATCSQELH